MMNRLSRRMILPILLVSPSVLRAQPASSPSDGRSSGQGDEVSAAARASGAPGTHNVAAAIEQQMTDYIRGSPLQELQTKGTITIVRGIADVRVNASNRDWVRFRSTAYERAYTDAQAKFLESQGLRIAAQASNDYFSAGGEEPPPFNAGAAQAPGQMNDLFRKLAGLANAQIDQLLREASLDPRQYEVAPPPQRAVMLRDSYRRSTVRRALGELSGMIACKTFEGHDGQGNFQIGVVGVISQRLTDFAADVLRRRGDFTPNPANAGESPETILDNKDDLVRQFGARRIFDAEGYPVIIAFGQWASANLGAGGSAARTNALERAAISQARAMADTQLSFFLSSQAAFETDNRAGDIYEAAVSRMPDNSVLPEADGIAIIDRVRERYQATSNVNIVGLADLGGVWRHKHPVTGADIIGVVRIWSPRAEQAARARQERPAPATQVLQPQQAVPPAAPPGTESGRSLMRARDF